MQDNGLMLKDAFAEVLKHPYWARRESYPCQRLKEGD